MERDSRVWDALWNNESIGRVAVCVMPDAGRLARAREACGSLSIPHPGEVFSWRDGLIDQLAALLAQMQLPGDSCPALYVPGAVHGQSQGICDLFGASVEPQPAGLYYVHPLDIDAGQTGNIRPRPIESGMYWGAVEWIRWAREATGGEFGFRIPVMTGPLDTASYLLGPTRLMDWLLTEPRALHLLLSTITGVIIEMVVALRDAAGGTLYPENLFCTRGGPTLCSECRSLISREHYEEFEAPYLRRIGDAIGPYAIHSCGSWERTVASALDDVNLRAMHGQVRENDLAELCRLSAGRITFSIGPSENVGERYTWADVRDFYDYVIATVPPTQPLEMAVHEADVPYLNECYESHRMWRQL